MMNSESKRLYRSRSERMIGGVCGGIGKYLEIDPTVIRLLFLLLAFLSGGVPAVIAYIILLFVVPEEPLATEPPKQE
ncbi:MAG: PspC domain-containing protein [Anaerolineales bacterium]|jgi:phage shock protein PspC (stress-responsive transcriptional regulator)|nr:PspC domain-containing protein [Anaerolineales bacterium]